MAERVELQAESWSEVSHWLVGHGRIRVPGLAIRVGARVELKLGLPSGMAVGFAGAVIDPAGGLVEVDKKSQGDLDLLVHMTEAEVDAERLASVLAGPPQRRVSGERKAVGAAGTPTPMPRSREVIAAQPRKPRPSVVAPELDLAAATPVARRVETRGRARGPDVPGLDGFAVELEPAQATVAPAPAAAALDLDLDLGLDAAPSLALEPEPAPPLRASSGPIDIGALFELEPPEEPPPVELGEAPAGPLELGPPAAPEPFELDAPPQPRPPIDFDASFDFGPALPVAAARPSAAPEPEVELGAPLQVHAPIDFDAPFDLEPAAPVAAVRPSVEPDPEEEFDVDLSSVDLPPAPLGPSLLAVSGVGAAAVLPFEGDEPDEPLSGGPVLGIGFGITRAEVAVVSGGKVFLATNDADVAGVPAKVHIPARDRQGKDASIVVSGMKRLLGRRADDPTNAGWLAQQPWRTTSVDGHVAVQLGGGAFAVPRLLAEVLKRLKLQAETALGGPATDTVIAVPLAYDRGQRQAVRQAARLAGLRVVGLVAEPVAAALAFGLGKARREVSLVFDLGGGSLEVTVLEGQGERFRVLAAVADPWLGGEDFDRALASEVLRALDPIARGAVDQAGLIAAAEQTKCALSTANEAVLSVPVLAGQPRQLKIDRPRFAAAVAGLVAQAQVALDRALAEAGVTTAAVQQIVLSGGMSRAPLVRELIAERFGRAFTQVVGPDEAVALGAALQGVALVRPRRR